MRYLVTFLLLAYISQGCSRPPNLKDKQSLEKQARDLASEIGAIGLRCSWCDSCVVLRGDCTAALDGNTVHISCRGEVCRLYTPKTVVRGGCSVAGAGL